MKSCLVILCLAVLTVSGCGTQRSVGNVSPAQFESSFLRAGGSTEFTVTVDLLKAPPSKEPVDIAFVFDATTSMLNVFEVVRTHAVDILASIGELTTDANVAVATFTDYGGAGPWHLHQDFSQDLGQSRESLQNLSVRDDFNMDTQEAYSRALHEVRDLSWRPGARRYLILFGDAPARDPNFYGEDLGIDAGRDGIENTADDLRFVQVVDDLRGAGIAALILYDDKEAGVFASDMTTTAKGFQYLAAETGGVAKLVVNARDIPAAIQSGLRDSLKLQPVLVAAPDWVEWAQISEPTVIGDGSKFDFLVRLHVPDSAAAGIHRFPLIATHAGEIGGAEIGRVGVTIRLGPANWDWRKILVPVYLFLLLVTALGWLVRHTTLSRALPYHGHHAVLRFLWRIALVALACSGAYGIWTFAPGQLPPFAP